MVSCTSRFLVSIASLALLAAPLFGQGDDYRRFFKKPETPLDFWMALKFEMDLGKYDLAGNHLKGLIEKLPADEEGDKFLLEIEAKDGMSAFLRLLAVPDWFILSDAEIKAMGEKLPDAVRSKLKPMINRSYKSEREFLDELQVVLTADQFVKHKDMLTQQANHSMRLDAGPLVERVSIAVQKFRSNPERIKKFIKNLAATPEERVYAIAELRRSGPIVVPFLIQEMVDNPEDASLRASLLTALLRLNRDVLPPLLAALDVDEAPLRAQLIEVLQKRGDPDAVPYLWYLSASPRQPDFVRSRATSALATLLDTKPDTLTPARLALTREAERYYYHKVKFPNVKAVTVWQWDGKQLVVPPPVYSVNQAEEYYGLRFARQALDIDPTYQPAQVVFLSMAVEKAYERAGLDQPLEKGSPTVKDLLRTVNPDLITAMLDRALTDRRLAVILGAVKTLGDLTEMRASRLQVRQQPPLLRALNYPDRRVQLAAADALLRFPGTPAPLSSSRIVEILRRASAAEAVRRVLVADPIVERGEEVGKALKQAGYEAILVRNGRDVLRRLAEAADIDAILVDQAIPDPLLPHLLGQLRADIDSGNLPVLVTMAPERDGWLPPEREQSLRRLIGHYRNTWLMRTSIDPETLKKTLSARIAETMGNPLAEEERKKNAELAMDWLRRMGAGEVAGYDLRPAETAILRALRSEELRTLAIGAAGGLPGPIPQRELAALVLDNGGNPKHRAAAAFELNRHIQQHGVALDRAQIKALVDLFNTSDDANLKGTVALVVGSMRPSPTRTGTRLQGYVPPPPAAAAAPAEKEQEKEKPKEKEKEKENEKEKEKDK